MTASTAAETTGRSPTSVGVGGPGRRHPLLRGPAEWAKASLERVGTATAGWRPPPDLLIVGSKRGGTTSLWEYLSEHPGLLPMFPAPRTKGLYFFSDHWDRGVAWYRGHFPTRAARGRAERRLGHPVAAGESSPYYLFHPLAPARAAVVAPEAVVVAVLRHPVERAYSHWKERCRHTERLDFAAALAAEEERTAGAEGWVLANPGGVSFAHRHQTYVAQSRYGPMLRRWFSAVGRDQCLVFTSEEFYAEPQKVCSAIWHRLGLPERTLLDPRPRNAAPSKGMDPGIRRELSDRLAPTIAEVDELLGRPTGWG